MPRVLDRHDRRNAGRVNMTPMIDVTFLLLTFFMLASHFASAEKTEIDLPDPDHSRAVEQRFRDKVIINLLYTGEHAGPALQLGAMGVGSMAELGQRLGEVARENPRVQVILRADRRLRYKDVRAVMELIAARKLTRLQVVAELESAG